MINYVKMLKKYIVRRNIFALLIFLPAIVFAQPGQDDLRREVRLYNPFKPSLNKANKISLFPELRDTTITTPEFRYEISPKAFMPAYEIRNISPARLEPDPLPELYKGFLNLGFGNYFSPFGELSISSDRSRKNLLAFYARHQSSFGNVRIDDDARVFGGYMDNTARLEGAKLLRRATLKAMIDFNHIRRYAYGEHPEIIAGTYETDKDSLRLEYFNPQAELNIFSTRTDSSKMKYDLSLTYNLLYQTSIYYQHKAGFEGQLGYDLDIFYAGLDLGYDFTAITNVEDKFRHRASINPAISKMSDNWSFRLGFNLVADARYYRENSQPREYKTKYFFHPDLSFRFSVIPRIFNMFVGLDGEYINNNASGIIYDNPFIVSYAGGIIGPSDDLYTILPTDVQLRVKGGFNGFASENTSYNFRLSYSMFENMVFYINPAQQTRVFAPVYDSGELLSMKAAFLSKINDEFSVSAKAAYYNYTLENIDEPWHKPTWDGTLSLSYNLRDKIIASGDLYAVSQRYAPYGPLTYPGLTDYEVHEIPFNISLNLGFEYRYTKILSFWAKLNNIAINRYYDWLYYPSQGFLFMAGFTYSL